MMPKFRVYDKHLKILTDISYIDFEGNELMYWLEDIQIVRDFDEVILMQSTGHKDKNGVEIFEGDIVKRTYLFNGGYGETHTGEVVYDEEYAQYVISRPQKYIEPKTEDLRNVLSDKSTYEVIGNICENPELMEVDE